jgi:transcriptional regulator with XRE-family HTH domain
MRRAADEFDIELGRRLRQARLAKGLSQQESGEHLGVSYQQVQKYERGTNRVSVTTLVRLQELYQVPLDFLIPSSGGASDALASSRRALKLLRDFETIRSGDVRRRLAALVRSLAEQGPAEPGRMRRLVTVTALALLLSVAACVTTSPRKPVEIFVEPRFGICVA